jgi:hypothetical protein
MTEATQRPWGYVHHKGLDQHLVGATLENVAIVEDRHGNAKENAEFIVKAVNSHDALVVAIEDMEESRENLEGLVQRLTIQNDALIAALGVAYDQLPCVCGDNFETCDCAVAKVTSALSEAVK